MAGAAPSPPSQAADPHEEACLLCALVFSVSLTFTETPRLSRYPPMLSRKVRLFSHFELMTYKVIFFLLNSSFYSKQPETIQSILLNK